MEGTTIKKKALAVSLAAALGASMLWGYGKESDAGASTPSASTAVESTDSSAASDTDSGIQLPSLIGHTLTIYCGAETTKPFQEVADVFKSHTGCEMDVTYANADQIQSQITASEEGDLFIVGSGDKLKLVEPYVERKKELVKRMLVLVVQSGNPKNITGLADLTGDGVALIAEDVDSTPIGKIAKKAMTDTGIFDQIQIEAITVTTPQMFTALAAKEADAAVAWKENYDVRDAEAVNTTDLDSYIKTIPVVSLSRAVDRNALGAFNQHLDMDTAKEIWVKYRHEIVE